MASNLPPGFELESTEPAPNLPGTAAKPSEDGLPPGFELEQPAMSASKQADMEQAEYDAKQASHGSLGQQAITGLESAASTGTFGLSGIAEKALGVKPEDIRAREEANPIASAVGSVAGLINPLGIEGKVLTKVGDIAAKKLAPDIVEKGILAGVKRGAVKLAAENALYQSGDEVSKLIKEDPNQSVQTAITDVGLAAVLGAGLGGGIGAVSPLWKATVGNKAGQFVADFKGRLSEHLNNPEPGQALTEELGNYHKSITDMASEVYGPQGLKSQEVSKLIPEEMTPKMSLQLNELYDKVNNTLEEMQAKQVPERYQKKFIDDTNRFQDIATKPNSSTLDVFNAAQDLKQTLQGYSKGNFGPFAIPSYHEAYDFLNSTKSLGKDFRVALEDPAVWGKAAERQQSINKAFSEYLPSLKDFEKKFTVEINGERVIDPGKVQTYVNQAGKASSEVKKSMLQNFVDASEKYKQVISDTHSNLGIENPMPHTSLTHIQSSLKDLPSGAKAADMWIKNSAAKAGGALIGAIAGKLSHIPFGEAAGAYFGDKFLGSIVPGIAKTLLEKLPSGEGLEAANKYGQALIKGAKLSDNAIKSIFRGGIILPIGKEPSSIQREKLSASLDKLQKDPEALANIGGHIGHYMPDHATALGMTSQRVVSFLNSIKPEQPPKAPLDKPLKPSRAVVAQYERALDIANQPLVVLQSLKEGTLTSHDVMALQAMYPELYSGLRQKVMNEMVAHVSKEEPISYKTKMGLSLFMGQALDSTMSQQSIVAAQPMPSQPPQMPQDQSSQGGKRPSQLKNKTSQMAFTGDQNAEAIAAGNRKA